MIRQLIAVVLLVVVGCSKPAEDYATLVRCDAPQPGSVSVTWLGVAGIYVSDGAHGILIDPFVSNSRVTLLDVARGRPLWTDERRVKQTVGGLGPVNAILVTHSHYDHAMDVPSFARHTGAKVFGSEATQKILHGHGLEEHPHSVIENSDNTLLKTIKLSDDFKIDVLRGRHGGIIFGYVPFTNEATQLIGPGSPARDYVLGEVYILRITHPTGTLIYTGSAEVPEESFDALPNAPGPAVAILTLTGRSDTRAYLQRSVGTVDATRVVPIHFDDLFEPTSKPVRILERAEFSEFIEVLNQGHPKALFAPQPIGVPCQVLPQVKN